MSFKQERLQSVFLAPHSVLPGKTYQRSWLLYSRSRPRTRWRGLGHGHSVKLSVPPWQDGKAGNFSGDLDFSVGLSWRRQDGTIKVIWSKTLGEPSLLRLAGLSDSGYSHLQMFLSNLSIPVRLLRVLSRMCCCDERRTYRVDLTWHCLQEAYLSSLGLTQEGAKAAIFELQHVVPLPSESLQIFKRTHQLKRVQGAEDML